MQNNICIYTLAYLWPVAKAFIFRISYMISWQCYSTMNWQEPVISRGMKVWQKMGFDVIGCLDDDQSGYELHFRVPLHNFFLHSGYTVRTNRHDMRQTITKQHQHLSDGPNVTDLRVVVCEGQAWRAVEQRGPRGWCPIKTGKTGLSPLTRRPSAQPPLSTWNTRRASSAVEAVAAGLLSPHSSCLSPSKPMSLLISPPISEWRLQVCLSSVSLLSICSYFLLLSFTILPPSLGVF